MFKSYASLCAERHRQFTKYPFTIHPFSKLRMWAEAVVFSTLLLMILLLPIWISSTSPSDDDPLYILLLCTHVVFVAVNIPINILTGFVDGKNRQRIELNHYKILKNYILSWMLVDFVQLFCVLHETSMLPEPKSYPHIVRTVCSVVSIEYFVMVKYHSNICTVLRMKVPLKTALEVLMHGTTYLSWNVLIQFVVEYYIEGDYQPVQPRNSSWITIGDLWDKPGEVRLMYSLMRAVNMLRKNSNLHLLPYDGDFEIFTTFAFIIAQCVVLHCTLKYMIALFGTQSSKAKYYMMSHQIQTYMHKRRFPTWIKKKVLKFYAIRFRSHFFVESTMLDCVTGQLHEDIIMHTGRHMVREVTFLKQLPWAVLIEISLKFQLAIFIEGDIIYKINTIGNCMYFINKGTVALYTKSGYELIHIEDGDHFGETALMSEDVKLRFVSAVAVTNCELFSLSRENFEIIERYRTAYDELKKVGVKRHQWAMVMDEQFKAQLREQKNDRYNSNS
ncbi:potassium/sodium hyperpolarization-activated cyclic nucleotide-gated channel 4-like [Cydia fagiglandana]|uniref:potassium/sodium hyperpolarization-activated cyclic nucleotide-gated channel 4-like n=1 Tax=Cydia fagiglandana TaxID=1458189 RepID=UPI002FEE11AC